MRTHSKSLPLHDNLMVEVESGADLAAGVVQAGCSGAIVGEKMGAGSV